MASYVSLEKAVNLFAHKPEKLADIGLFSDRPFLRINVHTQYT
jgi:hypothetical protein